MTYTRVSINNAKTRSGQLAFPLFRFACRVTIAAACFGVKAPALMFDRLC
jgi:hypothetical protein